MSSTFQIIFVVYPSNMLYLVPTISGVMISVFTFCAVDRRFENRSC